jgi:undecaprenyl pyrophosphate synthase
MAWNIAFEDKEIKYSRKDVYETSQRNKLTIPRLVEKVVEESNKLTRKELNTQICSIKEVYKPQEEVDKLHNTIGTAVTRLKKQERIEVTGIGDDAVISVPTKQAIGEETQWIETQI